ncbi:MAG TPA: SDR family oxidoreductase [Burkholderiaceae bacterium]|nr:SDR family oxidoreductase [Burkholderiaceae bacterium]
MSQEKKVALITGAGSGIGKCVALALGRAGYSLVLAGRRQAPLDEVAESARADGGEALVVSADISDADAVKKLFDATREKYGRLDLLFNNAGIFPGGVSLEELPVDQWKAAVDINLTGAFLCTQAAFDIMKAQQPQGGRIINNGSISAYAPRPNSVAYTATKHAITGLTKATSLDGRRYDIACGQIDIGNAASELTAGMTSGALQADGSTRPEPVMDVEHVADAVLYMAGLPLDTNVQFMTVMATKMPYIGRG